MFCGTKCGASGCIYMGFCFFQYVKIFIVLLHTSYKVYKSTICVDILTWGNSVKFDDEMRRHAYDLHLVEWRESV